MQVCCWLAATKQGRCPHPGNHLTSPSSFFDANHCKFGFGGGPSPTGSWQEPLPQKKRFALKGGSLLPARGWGGEGASRAGRGVPDPPLTSPPSQRGAKCKPTRKNHTSATSNLRNISRNNGSATPNNHRNRHSPQSNPVESVFHAQAPHFQSLAPRAFQLSFRCGISGQFGRAV